MNKIFFPLFLTAVILLAFSFNGICQKKDFQSWNEISLEKDLSKKASVSFEQDFRFQNNATLFKDHITEVGGQYKITKAFRIGGSYRYTHTIDLENGNQHEHRLSLEAIAKHKLQRFELAYKLRYQLNFEQFDQNRWHYLRNKFTVKYNLPKTSLLPFVEYEFSYSLNNPYKNSIDKHRFSLGFEYGLSKNIDVFSFYRIQLDREYFRTPSNKYILGLGASFQF